MHLHDLLYLPVIMQELLSLFCQLETRHQRKPKKAKLIMVSLRYHRWRIKVFRVALVTASLFALFWTSCCNNYKSCRRAKSANEQGNQTFKYTWSQTHWTFKVLILLWVSDNIFISTNNFWNNTSIWPLIWLCGWLLIHSHLAHWHYQMWHQEIICSIEVG